MLGAGGYVPIADYAPIGDCHTVALVSKAGSIDWFCPERFDAPAVFWRLLDASQGGYCSISPAGKFAAKRRYRPSTNILETTFRTATGEIRLTDFMPLHRRHGLRLGQDPGSSRQILRLVEGAGVLELGFKPAFNFGRTETRLTVAPHKGAIARAGRQRLTFYCPKAELEEPKDGEVRGRLELHGTERAWLVLTLTDSEQQAQEALDPDVSIRKLETTADYWEEWASACRYRGRYRKAVLRSALTLKLLTYAPTGAVVAAPTTSLPELIGGVRNWDYRYTWLRDGSLMLYALSTLGYHDEATDFIGWLARTTATDPTPTPQIMYTIDGQRELPESTLDHLAGYRASKPVRIGNAASEQHQLDIFGDVLSAAYHFRHTTEDDPATPTPEPHERISRRNWQLLSALVDNAAKSWQLPDSGIWEVRGGPRHFVYSKLMCWTALDRGIRLAQEQRLPAPIDSWRQTCQEIRQAILTRGYNDKLGAFTQALDGDELDASVLAIPRFGFLTATDPRVQSTVAAINRGLTRNGMVERYHAEDGLPGSEGTFALCSFWMVDALAMAGRTDEARALFEQLIGYANDVGLLSEEIDPLSSTDKLLGNFPQGFSHMALIGSAVNLARATKHGAEVRAQTEPERAAEAAPAAADDSSD